VASSRLKLLAIVGLFALPIVASTVAFHFFRPERTTNYGEFVTPTVPFPAAPLGRQSGGPFRFEELRGRWVLVASDSGACPAACAAKLTLMRQVRLALGRDAARVERVFVADDSKALPAEALAAHEGLVVLSPPSGLVLPPVPLNDRAHLYVADPEGRVMMRFPADADAKRVLGDLKRLLKASQIG
jgi:cytochrome oxidase Cu insertion factor (SCO1/SenC/PrrC family)